MNCPVCERKIAFDEAAVARGAKLPPHFPFCSDRCRLVDLGRWATGKYAVPGEPVDLDPLPED